MSRMLLIGKEPDWMLPYTYVAEPPYDGVVIGSLPLSQALGLRDDRILEALAAAEFSVKSGARSPLQAMESLVAELSLIFSAASRSH